MPREFTYHTERTITVVADTEEEAAKKVEAELNDDEIILSVEEEDI